MEVVTLILGLVIGYFVGKSSPALRPEELTIYADTVAMLEDERSQSIYLESKCRDLAGIIEAGRYGY